MSISSKDTINPTKKFGWLKSDYAKIAGGIFLFISTIILYSLEFTYFNNMFEVRPLLITALMLGIFIGTLLGDRFKKFAKSPLETFQIYTVLMMLSLLMMPLLISLTNRLFSFSSPRMEKVEFVKSEIFMESRFGKLPNQKPDGYFSFFIYNGAVHRIKTKINPFSDVEEGDIISIPICKGIWQYEWVDVSHWSLANSN